MSRTNGEGAEVQCVFVCVRLSCVCVSLWGCTCVCSHSCWRGGGGRLILVPVNEREGAEEGFDEQARCRGARIRVQKPTGTKRGRMTDRQGPDRRAPSIKTTAALVYWSNGRETWWVREQEAEEKPKKRRSGSRLKKNIFEMHKLPEKTKSCRRTKYEGQYREQVRVRGSSTVAAPLHD